KILEFDSYNREWLQFVTNRMRGADNSDYDLSIQDATNIYYQSETAQLIEEKVADLHCRSEKYLATLIWEEHLENAKSKPV
ncbi:MAG: hypothetical protein NC127_08325, partial [Muribaculum sp.]|nr:hypothetical protein [Muribaculum sp.]